MATCKCGGRTIRIKKQNPKKVQPKKVTPKKQDSGNQSARAKRLSVQATRRATKLAKSRPNPFAKGCNCS